MNLGFSIKILLLTISLWNLSNDDHEKILPLTLLTMYRFGFAQVKVDDLTQLYLNQLKRQFEHLDLHVTKNEDITRLIAQIPDFPTYLNSIINFQAGILNVEILLHLALIENFDQIGPIASREELHHRLPFPFNLNHQNLVKYTIPDLNQNWIDDNLSNLTKSIIQTFPELNQSKSFNKLLTFRKIDGFNTYYDLILNQIVFKFLPDTTTENDIYMNKNQIRYVIDQSLELKHFDLTKIVLILINSDIPGSNQNNFNQIITSYRIFDFNSTQEDQIKLQSKCQR